MLKKLAVELFGTYLLVIAATGVIISQDVPFIGIAASPAIAVMIMILVLGHFSDVHLNPAVSLAFLILKKISLKTFIAYVGWQLVGGAFGALTLKAIYTQKVAAEVKLLGAKPPRAAGPLRGMLGRRPRAGACWGRRPRRPLEHAEATPPSGPQAP